MGKTDAEIRRALNAFIRHNNLPFARHLCRFCKEGEHGRCEEDVEDRFLCYCDCNEVNNRPHSAAQI